MEGLKLAFRISLAESSVFLKDEGGSLLKVKMICLGMGLARPRQAAVRDPIFFLEIVGCHN